METAARRQLDERLAKQGVEGARRIDHRRGGGGFDDVVVIFSGTPTRPKAKILIREVKGHIDGYVPLDEFSAIRPPGLGENLKALDKMVDDALAALRAGIDLPPGFEGITHQQLNSIKHAMDNHLIEIEIVLGPTTKIGRESSKRASVLRDLRREIKKDRGKDILSRGEPDRIERDLVQDAAAAEDAARAADAHGLASAGRASAPADLAAPAERRAQVATELATIQVTVAPISGAPRGSYYVTRADADRMSALFAELDGAQTIGYKDGLLVRHGGEEWYFQIDDMAHALPAAARAQSRTSIQGVAALPESNVATVELWGFRGVRSIKKAGDPRARLPDEWTPQEHADVEREAAREPLLAAGHVGISFDGGDTIYGLTPEWRGKMTLEECRQRLVNHEILPGIVDEDTEAFTRARELADANGWNTELERVVVMYDRATQPHLVEEVERIRSLPPGAVFGYTFPSKEPGQNGQHFQGGASYDGRFTYCSDQVSNCATWPSKLGVPIPESSGNMARYMPELKKWAEADAPIDMRPKEPAQ